MIELFVMPIYSLHTYIEHVNDYNIVCMCALVILLHYYRYTKHKWMTSRELNLKTNNSVCEQKQKINKNILYTLYTKKDYIGLL